MDGKRESREGKGHSTLCVFETGELQLIGLMEEVCFKKERSSSAHSKREEVVELSGTRASMEEDTKIKRMV